MRNVTQGKKQGLQWTLTEILENLDNDDDLGLIARDEDILQETEHLNPTANKIGKSTPKKTQVLRMNTTNCSRILVNNKPLEEIEKFTYKVITTGDWQKDQQSQPSFWHVEIHMEIHWT